MLVAEEVMSRLKGIVSVANGDVKIENEEKFRNEALEVLVRDSVIHNDKEVRGLSRYIIKAAALKLGIEFGQGWYLGKPKSLENLIKELKV